MILARVLGSTVATDKHPAYVGTKVLICKATDLQGVPTGVGIRPSLTLLGKTGDLPKSHRSVKLGFLDPRRGHVPEDVGS